MSVENLHAEMLALAAEFGRFYDRLCPLYTEWNELVATYTHHGLPGGIAATPQRRGR